MAPSGEEDRTAFCETVDNLLSAVEALGALSWPQPRPGAGPLAVGAPEVDPTNPTKVCVPSPLARSFPSRVSLCLSLNNMPEP